MTAATVRAWASRSAGSRSISGRSPRSVAATEMAARTRPSVAPAARASGSRIGSTDGGIERAAAVGGLEGGEFVGVGQVADGDEVPDLVEAVAAGEVRGVEAAVVVAALVAEHVADAGLGDGDAVEPGGNVDQVVMGSIVARSTGPLINVDRINIDPCTTLAPCRRYVGAAEAARQLGVQRATLYAYVSRGLVERRVAVDGRTSLYSVDDLEALAGRTRPRRDPEARPSLDVQIVTAVTELDEAGPRYRGRDVAELARSVTYEQVAELLWSGSLPDRADWPAPSRA